MDETTLDEKLESLVKEAKELYLFENIQTIDVCPSPLEFLRKYVMANQPVVIRDGVKHWPALDKWNLQYLKDKIGEKMVTVSFTPNGLADAPIGNCFVLPHDKKLKFKEIVNVLETNDPCDVAYVQNQNSNFLEEFEELISDAESHIPWASESFGKRPDAVNIWIGNRHSITSTHKDHYENLYAVVAGSKSFYLYPPTDLPCFEYKKYIVGRYLRDDDANYCIVNNDDIDICEQCKNNIKCANDILKDFMDSKKMFYDTNYKKRSLEESKSSFVFDYSKENRYYEQNKCTCTCNNSKVPWISDDPLSCQKTRKFFMSNPLRVTLYPGDLLYLPSLWFHHVQQTDHTIAVNFWYDMEYDIKYNYFKFVESLVAI